MGLIPRLAEDHQVHVVGYWEVTKRKNIDIGPLGACTLTYLIKIVCAQDEVRQQFGFKNKKSAEEVCNSLPALRNNVMHPVRPLIGKSGEIAGLVSSIDKLHRLIALVPRKPSS